MTLLTSSGFIGEEATSDLFGGNVLATRSTMTGEGSYAELIDDLGSTVLRYPGGSLTESYFDLSNPDSSVVYDPDTGEAREFIPISDFMEYAAANDHEVVLVIPTRTQLSDQPDETGNRVPELDEDVLRQFVNDVVSGMYGDADIAAFELGNEYWGSGEMNSFEYGALASEMSVIINDELNKLAATYPDADDIEIVAQVGTNFNYAKLSTEYQGWASEDVIDDINETQGLDLDYSAIGNSGNINWTKLANQIITSQFDTADETQALDGVVAHVYTKGPDLAGQRSYQLDTIQENWIETFEDLEIYVTEWNASGATSALDGTEDYGLYQAHEMLNIVEEMMLAGVDVANVWPLLQNTDNALSYGQDYSELTAPGEMFRMMAETLPGKRLIDLEPANKDMTETSVGDIDAHAFYGDGDLVFYFASTAQDETSEDIDVSNLVESAAAIKITVLGVADGEAAGNSRSDAAVREIDPETVFADGTLAIALNPGEVMQVVFDDIVPADGFIEEGADLLMESVAADVVVQEADVRPFVFNREEQPENDTSASNSGGEPNGATEFPVPTVEMTDEFIEENDPDAGRDAMERSVDQGQDDDSDGGDAGGLAGILLLLPLLLLGGL